jgi:trans-2,3-dihydro-3-hydroxyanthranilate isomerase
LRRAYHILDVFTDRAFTGNPLAVFPDAGGIPEAQMQRAAAEFNLSETVFVLPPERGGTRRVRIFTPRRELPFAGHPTVGTALLLAALGATKPRGGSARAVLEEVAGDVEVGIDFDGDRPVRATLTAPQAPVAGPPPPSSPPRAAARTLAPEDILEGHHAPAPLSCGVPFLFVALRDRATVGRARVEAAAWERAFGDYWASEPYLYSMDAELPGADIHARLFAPGFGIAEDPATGSAAVTLGALLAMRDPRPEATLRWTVEQGLEIGRPSLLHLETEKRGGRVTAARVGGAAVRVAEGRMEFSYDT